MAKLREFLAADVLFCVFFQKLYGQTAIFWTKQGVSPRFLSKCTQKGLRMSATH